MPDPQDLVSRMQEFCGFLAGLGDVQAEVLLAPMAEGKWSVQEAIAHIMAYDESFLQSTVLPIEEGRGPHIADEADNQSFNERAAALGRKLTKRSCLRGLPMHAGSWWTICSGCPRRLSGRKDKLTAIWPSSSTRISCLTIEAISNRCKGT